MLLRAEEASEQHPWDNTNSGHWYDYLKAQLVNPPEMLGKDQLRIITFNYDRSLEHCLFRSLKPFYTSVMTEEVYTAAMNQFQVLHVYGSLGPLPWQSADGAVPYGARGYGPILAATKNVKVLHEGAEDAVQQNFKTAQEWLKWADKILFLGFGFHHDNVKRLNLRETLRDFDIKQTVGATCLGLDATSRGRVEYYGNSESTQRLIGFAPATADCYTFLHSHAVLS